MSTCWGMSGGSIFFEPGIANQVCASLDAGPAGPRSRVTGTLNSDFQVLSGVLGRGYGSAPSSARIRDRWTPDLLLSA